MQLSNWSLLTGDTGHQVRKEDLNSASEMEVERAAVVGIMIDMCQIAAPSLRVAFWPLMFSVCVLQRCGARSYQFTLIGLTQCCPWGNAISGRFYCFKPDHLLEEIFMLAYMCGRLRWDSKTKCLFGVAVPFIILLLYHPELQKLWFWGWTFFGVNCIYTIGDAVFEWSAEWKIAGGTVA